jgi:NADH-quinone oxidoreductase subunit G
MAIIYIDGKEYEVDKDQNLLEAALSLGLNLPYFCWHPALGSVGACRQCAIIRYKDEEDTEGKLVMACLERVEDGMRVSIEAPGAREFRASVIEWLMVNHPHDCPICDEGGECHLQDMTVMTGHNYRRFRFKKRTHLNQNLGPFINHEMNRCIACYRCVRFYKDFAGGKDLDVFSAHDHVYFGRYEEGMLQSEFSGNLVEVCPTGVFTDKTLKKHYARKWDLQSGPSVCQHCSLGCNTLVGERYNRAVRILNRYNRQVNGYFICDRGRFGYEFVNSPGKIKKPSVKGTDIEIYRVESVEEAASQIKNSEKVIGIGSPRASLEANFALKTMVGKDNFYSGMSTNENRMANQILNILRNGQAASASFHDVELADAVLVLGEDLTNTAPMLDLAIRQAVLNKPIDDIKRVYIPRWDDNSVREFIQGQKGPFYLATINGTKLDEIATKTYRAVPYDIARLGYAVAHEIDSNSPGVKDLPDEVKKLAKEIASALKDAKYPVIISGMSMRSEALIQAAANVAWALRRDNDKTKICYTLPECNSLGSAFLEGQELEKAFKVVSDGKADTVVILENDLYWRADKSVIDKFFDKCKNVIVLDHLQNATTEKAHVLISAATFAEGDGTLVNNEGRAQRFFQALNPDDIIQESWKWLRDIMIEMGDEKAKEWKALDDVSDAMLASIPGLNPKIEIAPSAGFRIDDQKIPRSGPRYSGRTAMRAKINVHEPKPPDDPDSPLSFSMEGYRGQRPASLISFFWSPGWNSVQSINKYQQEIDGPLKGGDSGIRLIEPKDDAKAEYFNAISESHKMKDAEFIVLPLYHIFGSEELSVQAEELSKAVPKPYLALNRKAAEKISAKEQDEISLKIAESEIKLPLKIIDNLPLSGMVTK